MINTITAITIASEHAEARGSTLYNPRGNQGFQITANRTKKTYILVTLETSLPSIYL